jgi:uncharacterized protein
MPELFFVKTDRATLTLSGARPNPPGSRMGRLALGIKRTGLVLSPETWREGVPSDVGCRADVTDGPLLFEETGYSFLLEAGKSHSVQVKHRDPTIMRGLSTSRDSRTVHGTINFRSQVGRSRFTVIVDDQPEFDFEVEVSPSKLDYETDYAELTAEVQAILSGLVLQYLSATFEGASIDEVGESSELEWTVLLRHVVGDLEQALLYIAKRPIRGLHRTTELVRAERVKRVDSRIRRSVARGRGGGPLGKLPSGIPVRSLLAEQLAKPTLDTAEHRWLAMKVAAARRRLAEIRQSTASGGRSRYGKGSSPRHLKVLEELQQLEHQLARLSMLEPLAAATRDPVQGFSSLQLQGAPGYRAAYHACITLARGLRLSGGPVELSLKDVHLLYEYWCFLAVVTVAGEVLKQPIPAEQLLIVEQNGLRVRLKEGRRQKVVFEVGDDEVVVTYAPSFGGADYLLPQKPDISLTLRRGGWPLVRLVLDAKYRLDTSESFVSQMGAPGPPFDAMNVLHRYRDAILDREKNAAPGDRGLRTVVEGAALFPLSGIETDEFDSTKMWESLEQLGIGAIPFLPSQTTYLRTWLKRVMARSGWAVADKIIPSATRERLHDWRRAAAESVLVAVLRSDEEAHLEWIQGEGVHYTPFTPSQPLQLAAKWVAIYRRASGGTTGRVTHVAPIASVEVLERRELQTPWPSTRGAAEPQAVYRIGALIPLSNPIENQRGERFSTNRWTSKLGLSKAHSLSELLLETEPEWRLYDELRLLGKEVEIHPGRPTQREVNNPRGRAWIECAGTRAQYRGQAGWYCGDSVGDGEYLANVEAVISALASDG